MSATGVTSLGLTIILIEKVITLDRKHLIQSLSVLPTKDKIRNIWLLVFLDSLYSHPYLILTSGSFW